MCFGQGRGQAFRDCQTSRERSFSWNVSGQLWTNCQLKGISSECIGASIVPGTCEANMEAIHLVFVFVR